MRVLWRLAGVEAQLPELTGQSILLAEDLPPSVLISLDRTKLGFGERMMVKAVKAPDGDFRDWNAISAWADEIGRELAEG